MQFWTMLEVHQKESLGGAERFKTDGKQVWWQTSASREMTQIV